MYLVGCLYYLYQCCTVKQISDNEIYLLIKYIKSVLWKVAKCLSYIEEVRCLKVNEDCHNHHQVYESCVGLGLPLRKSLTYISYRPSSFYIGEYFYINDNNRAARHSEYLPWKWRNPTLPES